MINDDWYNKQDEFYKKNGIQETFINDEKPSSRWNKTYVEIKFPNGDIIKLQYGPISQIDQLYGFLDYKHEIITTKLKRIKLENLINKSNG